MGFLGSMFGGSRGMGYEVERAASPEQAQQLYNQQQERLRQQQAFAQALQAQAPGAIAAQQQLLGQLRGQAMGTAGPSVAQRQLAQTTGENIAAQQALMAGQRGASANVGLMGRQAALAGSRAQQQAAGQAATLRAQEQLASQQALSSLTGQQMGQIAGAQQLGLQGVSAAQQNILNAIAQRNAAQAGIEQQIAQGQGGFLQGLMGGAAMLAGKPMAEGGEVESEDSTSKIGEKSYWDKFKEGYQKSMFETPAKGTPMFEAGKSGGQLLAQGLGSLLKKKPDYGTPGGGYAGANLNVPTQMPAPVNPLATSQAISQMRMPQYQPSYAKGGKVPAMVSPGERYLPPHEVDKVKSGEKEPHKAGRSIPGKAKVEGDSLKNDTVPATLEEGGIVIPRSVMQSKDPAEKARQFVAAVLAKKQSKRK